MEHSMHPSLRRALEYVRNTNTGATVANFIEDHEPIGYTLWAELFDAGYVTVNDEERIIVTDHGRNALEAG